jgi:glycosyltransferase involved in cell wall biosynthesis
MSSEWMPLFTVVIPTRDRAPYLEKTLLTCRLQTYPNFEVVVSDDGSVDDTRQVVERASAGDGRIRYVTPGKTVGMRDNFEFALNHVKPGFVMALGGDDGLLPRALEGMRDALQRTGQELLTWPCPVFNYAGARTPTPQLILPFSSGLRIVNSSQVLARQARELSYVNDEELPMFYVKGVASTRLVDRVRSRSVENRFYVCSTPDGYSGIVLAGETETFAFSGIPFSIFGASPTSQGIAYVSSNTAAKEQSGDFFRRAVDVPMHRELGSQPYSPLISLMTADFLLHARDLPGWPGKFEPIRTENLLAKAVAELAHGLYSEDRLVRELAILSRIAEYHGLRNEFRNQVRRTRRSAPKEAFSGSGIRPGSAFFDGVSFGLHDIVDAAYFTALIRHARSALSLSSGMSVIQRSLEYRLRSYKQGRRFPSDKSWFDLESGGQ